MITSDAISYKISDVMNFYFEKKTYFLKMNDEFKKNCKKFTNRIFKETKFERKEEFVSIEITFSTK